MAFNVLESGDSELSLGEIAQSGNTLCGRSVGCPVWDCGPESLTDPLPRARCRLFLFASDDAHENTTVTGRTEAKHPAEGRRPSY